MKIRFTLIRIHDPGRKGLVARLLAQNPKISMSEATAFTDHLPATVLQSVDYDEAKRLADGLRRLGCVCEMEPVPDAPSLPSREPQETSAPPPELQVELKEERDPKEEKESPKPFIAGGEKPRGPNGKSSSMHLKWISALALLLVFIAAVFFAKRFWVWENPYDAGRAASQKQLLSQIRETEAAMAQDMEDLELRLKAADQYRRLAATAKGPTKRMEYLTKAVRLNPEGKAIRAQLAQALVDTAQRTRPLDGKIRFYRMALSFNRENMSAWNGLVEAYEKMGMKEEAQKAQMERDEIFSKRYSRLVRVARSYGTLLGPPGLEGKDLKLSYGARTMKRDLVLGEIHTLSKVALNIRGVDRVVVKAVLPDGSSLRIASAITDFSPNVEEWMKGVVINPNPKRLNEKAR